MSFLQIKKCVGDKGTSAYGAGYIYLLQKDISPAVTQCSIKAQFPSRTVKYFPEDILSRRLDGIDLLPCLMRRYPGGADSS